MVMIAWIALLVLVGVVAWGIVSTSKAQRPRNDAEEEEQLKQQKARGEINDVEFSRRMAALHH